MPQCQSGELDPLPFFVPVATFGHKIHCNYRLIVDSSSLKYPFHPCVAFVGKNRNNANTQRVVGSHKSSRAFAGVLARKTKNVQHLWYFLEGSEGLHPHMCNMSTFTTQKVPSCSMCGFGLFLSVPVFANFACTYKNYYQKCFHDLRTQILLE